MADHDPSVCYAELTVCPTCLNDWRKCVGPARMRPHEESGTIIAGGWEQPSSYRFAAANAPGNAGVEGRKP